MYVTDSPMIKPDSCGRCQSSDLCLHLALLILTILLNLEQNIKPRLDLQYATDFPVQSDITNTKFWFCPIHTEIVGGA
mgnify:CR=1 FL=1